MDGGRCTSRPEPAAGRPVDAPLDGRRIVDRERQPALGVEDALVAGGEADIDRRTGRRRWRTRPRRGAPSIRRRGVHSARARRVSAPAVALAAPDGATAGRPLDMPKYASRTISGTLTAISRMTTVAIRLSLSNESTSSPPDAAGWPAVTVSWGNCLTKSSTADLRVETDLRCVRADERPAENAARQMGNIVLFERFEDADGNARHLGNLAKGDAAFLARFTKPGPEVLGLTLGSHD